MGKLYTTLSAANARRRQAEERAQQAGIARGWKRGIEAAAGMAEVIGDKKTAAAIRKLRQPHD